MIQTFSLATTKQRETIDITSEVENLVSKEDVGEGICLINIPHATAAIYLNENEPGLNEDILNFLTRISASSDYKHDQSDGNAQSHLISLLLGTVITLPITQGKISLGTWQRIIFLELDGPRPARKVYVSVLK